MNRQNASSLDHFVKPVIPAFFMMFVISDILFVVLSSTSNKNKTHQIVLTKTYNNEKAIKPL